MEEYSIYFEIFGCRIEFGWNKVTTLGPHASRLGAKRAFVVTDEGVLSTGIPERVSQLLRKEGIQSVLFKDVSPNPTDLNVRKGTETYKAEGCDLIVGVGGGSPLDAAKGIRVLVSHPEPLEQYFGNEGMEKIVNPMPSLITIPTTSGTGSEVSRGAMVTDTKRNVKKVIRATAPSVALVDPELTLGLPPHLTASTGIDALSHNIETFLSPRFHPVVDGIACEGIRLVGENLIAAVEDGKNQKARMLMAMASTMGALAFQKGTGAAHALAHQLSPEFGVPHGVAIAIMLPHVMEFNRDIVKEKLTRIAFAMGEKSPLPEGAIQAVNRLRQKVGVPGRLSEVGVVEKGIPLMAQHAMEDSTRLTNPRPCTENDMATLYRRAL